MCDEVSCVNCDIAKDVKLVHFNGYWIRQLEMCHDRGTFKCSLDRDVILNSSSKYYTGTYVFIFT